MKTGKNIIWGIALVVLGVILGINSLGILDINIFFDGWWTLFIIVPSFVGIFSDDNKAGSITFLIIGVLLLLACQDVIGFDVIAELTLPIIIVMIGLSLLFKSAFNRNINKSINDINSKSNGSGKCSAIFTGQDIKFDDQEFNGTSLDAIFGGINLDLRKANIQNDVVIQCKSIFGGIDIYLPDNVGVEVKSNSVFGGVDNKKNNGKKDITVYIDATCVFGGVDIK